MKHTKYPIFIPTKGRADNCLTAKLLRKHDIHFYLVVEPQDFENYAKVYGAECLVKLEFNSNGLSFARRHIKKVALAKGYDYHWQMDDDVQYFQLRENNKNTTRDPLEVLGKLEDYISAHSGIAIAGLKDSLFAWTVEEEIGFNKLIASVLLINTRTPFQWEDGMIEDVDYALQCCYKGYCTLIFNKVLYVKAPNRVAAGGVLTGGGQSKYDQHLIRLCNKWSKVLSWKRCPKTGRVKLKPTRVWLSFKQRPKKKV